MQLAAVIMALALALALVSCGGGDGSGSPDDDPVLRAEDRVEVSKACQDGFEGSHMREQAGEPTASAFCQEAKAQVERVR